MALIKISEYRNNYFTSDSRPSLNTIKNWIKREKVYGAQIDGKYYIDPEVVVPVNHLVERVLLKSSNQFSMKQKILRQSS